MVDDVDATVDALVRAAERSMELPGFPRDVYRKTLARALHMPIESTWEEVASKIRSSVNSRNKRMVAILKMGLLAGGSES